MTVDLLIVSPQELTRPSNTEAYSPATYAASGPIAGTLIANSTVGSSVQPYGFSVDAQTAANPAYGAIVGVILECSAPHEALIRVHFWYGAGTRKPVVTGGDRTVITVSNFTILVGDPDPLNAKPVYIGYTDITVTTGPAANSVGGDDNVFLPYSKAPSDLIYALLEFREGKLVPAAGEKFRLGFSVARYN